MLNSTTSTQSGKHQFLEYLKDFVVISFSKFMEEEKESERDKWAVTSTIFRAPHSLDLYYKNG